MRTVVSFLLIACCALPCGCTPAMRGGLDLAGGDYQGALARYHEALAAHPDSIEIRRRIGMTYFTMKDYARAEAVFADVLSRAPDTPEAAFYLGLSRVGKGEIDRGLAELATFSWPGKFMQQKYVRDEASLLLKYPGQPAEEIIRRLKGALEEGKHQQDILEKEEQIGLHYQG